MKLSRRAEAIPGSEIRKMFDLARTIPDCIHLEIGEPDFDTPQHVLEAAERAAREGHTHYTATAGYPALREALAKELKERIGIQVDPQSEVIVTVGAIGALSLALLALVDEGEEVICSDPYWPNYLGQIIQAGGSLVTVPLREERGFRIAAEDIGARITPRTRVLLLNSPGNPTGAVLIREDLEAIAQIAIEHDLAVVSDEIYDRLSYVGQPVSIAALPGMAERTVTVNGFSKAYAMTGWRVGYAAGPRRIIEKMVRLQESNTACVPSVSQLAALAALTGPQEPVEGMIAEYRKRREVLVNGLNSVPGITCRMPDGAFYAFPSIQGTGLTSSEAAMRILEEAKVVTVPGHGFGPGGEGFLRVSFANSLANIEEAIARLHKLAERGWK